jgi:hypothetical protein
MASQGLPDEDAQRYLRRLSRILRTWHEFRPIRPDTIAFQRALRSLPEDQFEALLDPSKGARRSRKARAHLYRSAFDAEIVESLIPAVVEAIDRAGSPDDEGALAVALYSLRTWTDGSAPLEANPLFAVLLDVCFDELFELTQALKEAEAAACPPAVATEGQPAAGPAEGAAAPDEAERQKRMLETMAKHPAFQFDAERRAFRLGNRLLRYVGRGVVRAHLTPDELGGLPGRVRQSAKDIVARVAETEQADARASVPDVLMEIRAFAADPANDGAFRRFCEALAAEAREAADKALPLAEHVQALAEFCRFAAEPTSPIRVTIAQASLARLQAEAETAPSHNAPRA